MNLKLRTIVERISRNRIFQRKLYVNQKSIGIYVSPDAQLKYLKFGRNAFDQDLIEIVENFVKKDFNVWDVGANIGVFGIAASAIADNGSILFFEPDIWLATVIRKSISLQKNPNLEVIPAAVSSTNGLASFLIAERGRASNALESAGGHSQMGGVRDRQLVPTISLDYVANMRKPPNFIKIDVEGAEYDVLMGSKNILTNNRPIVYIEVGSKTYEKITSFFERKNYQLVEQYSTASHARYGNILYIPK